MKKRAIESDLTTGSIWLHFRTLAVPAAIGMVFSTLYNLVDIYFAGRLDTASQAGLGLGFTVFFVLIAFGFGLNAAMGALVGEALGKKKAEDARLLAAQGLTFSVIASFVLIVPGLLFGGAFIELISEAGNYRVAGKRYFYILLLSTPGFLVGYTCNGILQAQGDSVSMQRALIAAFFANIALNPLLIYGVPGLIPGLGFDGIAVATVISQTGVLVFLFTQVLRSKAGHGISKQDIRPKFSYFRAISQQMLPTSFTFQIMILSSLYVQFILKNYGEHALAAYGVGMRIEQLLLLSVLGVSTSLLPIAAQNFGARKFDRVRQSFWVCVKISMLIMALTTPFLWFASRPVLQLFSSDPDVIDTGIGYLRVEAFLLPMFSMLFIFNSLLQALKRPIWTLWISIYRQGIGLVFFIWVYIELFNMNIFGVWFGIGTGVLTGLLLAIVISSRVAKNKIGGLWSAHQPEPEMNS